MGSVKGINETIKELRKFGKDAIELINAETEDAANDIAGNAKIKAPKNFGKLAQSISVAQDIKSRGQIWGVFVNEFYGAYMEFGTGTKVQVPAEFANMAKEFKGQKKGTFKEGLEAIKVWCRAKGIDEKAAYPIFAKILGAGIEPKPFLYPAYIQGKRDYLNNLTKLLKSFNKKI
jgi:HK97 gp10 family phage protein